MKTQHRVLPISSCVQDMTLYPRNKPDWMTALRYSEAMKAGSKFPPITVAKTARGLIVVDGWHRLEANKRLKEKHIQATVLYGLSDEEIFVQAVQLNATHGRQFGTQEMAKVIVRLEDMHYNKQQISKIIGIPIKKLAPFVAARQLCFVTRQPVIVKNVLKPMVSTTPMADRDDIDKIQEQFSGISQHALLDEVITLLENNFFDINDPVIALKLQQVYEGIEQTIKQVA